VHGTRSEIEPKHACSLDPVYFAFDKALLTTEDRNTLKRGDECLKKTPDPDSCRHRIHGYTEYNMACPIAVLRREGLSKTTGRQAQPLRTVPRGESMPLAPKRPAGS